MPVPLTITWREPRSGEADGLMVVAFPDGVAHARPCSAEMAQESAAGHFGREVEPDVTPMGLVWTRP